MADRRAPLRPFVLEPVPPGMTCKPWFKDKLPSKCLANQKSNFLKFPTSLDSRNWVFVREGLDDFRNGCPPCDHMIARGRKEAFLPMISHKAPQLPSIERKLPRKASLFSKLSQAQLARKAFVAATEAKLRKHPLARYSNLEESLPPDLLLKVLEELDPEKKLEDAWAHCEGKKEKPKEPAKVSKRRTSKARPKAPPPETFPAAEQPKKSRRRSSVYALRDPSILRRYVPRMVRDFCKWAAASGYHHVDEDYVMQQFTISHKWKPGFRDYHMMKEEEIHPDLKYNMELDETDDMKYMLDHKDWKSELKEPPQSIRSTRVKMRYGAWYLKTSLWKKQMTNEPLIDPKIILEAERERMKPDVIDDLYGTIAFKDFILSRGYSMPHILEKLFTRKGWDYEAVKTPIPKVIKIHLKLREFTEEDDMTIVHTGY
ncbi:putative protein FAM47C [Ochotona princeps]|uniref:putative protein FAM47C n=1 Tax=Ochotona princeps TaxID=9978 RepID=UPI002715009D|nr:putative protein FAM47C [Ochotona princeps]